MAQIRESKEEREKKDSLIELGMKNWKSAGNPKDT